MPTVPVRRLSRYSGELARPITVQARKGIIDSVIEEHRVGQETARKVGLLLYHYGIRPSSPDVWMQLALRLAMAHVPGLRSDHQRARGRPVTYQAEHDIQLFLDIRQAREELRLAGKPAGVTAACRVLAERDLSTSGKLVGRRPEVRNTAIDSGAKTLRNRYAKFRSRLQRLLEDEDGTT